LHSRRCDTVSSAAPHAHRMLSSSVCMIVCNRISDYPIYRLNANNYDTSYKTINLGLPYRTIIIALPHKTIITILCLLQPYKSICIHCVSLYIYNMVRPTVQGNSYNGVRSRLATLHNHSIFIDVIQTCIIEKRLRVEGVSISVHQ